MTLFKKPIKKPLKVKVKPTDVSSGGVCGGGSLDYDVNTHTTLTLKGTGCVGNPFSAHPIETGGGASVTLSFNF